MIQRRRAVALLLSLATLAVMSLMALVLIRTMRMERTSSANHVLGVRARLVAEAGLERAMADLQTMIASASSTSSPWVLRNDAGNGLDYAQHVDLEKSKFPSLPFDRDGDGTFENGAGGTSSDDLVFGRAVSGVIASPSGHSGSNFGAQLIDDPGQAYVLRIRDASAKLWLNGPQASLASTLDALGKALVPVEFYDPVAGKGAAIVALRDSLPGKQFNELAQLEPVLGADAIDDLRGYLCCHAWADPSTVAPDPQTSAAALPSAAAEARAPVNVNTAAPALLRALFSGLRGYVRTHAATAVTMTLSAAISEAQASDLAAAIDSARTSTPFSTWPQFEAYLRTTGKSAASLSDAQVAALIANCNPNTRCSRFAPDQALAAGISKLDLTYATTELCFGSMGVFEIESLGLITARRGQVLARALVRASVEVGTIVRHTTQAQFETAKSTVVNAASRPNSIASATASTADGSLGMFIAPPPAVTFTHTNYCIRITSNPAAKNPSNHIVVHVPDEHVSEAMASVTNNRGWKVVKEKREPKTGIKGFKFTPGVLGGKGKTEVLEFCFSIPIGAMPELKLVTKKASTSHVIAFDLTPPEPGVKTDANGFKVEFTGFFHHDDKGNTSKGMPDLFYATFFGGFDAALANGSKTATTDKTKVGLLAGGQMPTGGLLTRRATSDTLQYAATGNIGEAQGTTEFWVKLGTMGSSPSVETLYYAMLPTSTSGVFLAHKIVKDGGKLISTRELVQLGSPPASTYAHGSVSTEADISSWGRGEWHHVAVSWTDGTAQTLFVDGTPATSFTRKTPGQKLTDNDAVDRMSIGGYATTGGTVSRSLSVISRLKQFSTIEYSSAFTPKARYAPEAAPLLNRWEGAFSLSLTTGLRVKSISWTEAKPASWGGTAIAAADVDVTARVKVGSGSWTAISGGAADGSGHALDATVTPSSPTVRYEFTFAGTNKTSTALIDDVTIVLVGAPRVLFRTVD